MVIEKKIEAGQQKTRLAGLDNSLPTGAMDGPMSWATPLPVSLFLYEKKFFTSQFFFSLPLYSGDEVWDGIWNQTHLAVLNLSREIISRLIFTISQYLIFGLPIFFLVIRKKFESISKLYQYFKYKSLQLNSDTVIVERLRYLQILRTGQF